MNEPARGMLRLVGKGGKEMGQDGSGWDGQPTAEQHDSQLDAQVDEGSCTD
jgi:hypothetical protein